MCVRAGTIDRRQVELHVNFTNPSSVLSLRRCHSDRASCHCGKHFSWYVKIQCTADTRQVRLCDFFPSALAPIAIELLRPNIKHQTSNTKQSTSIQHGTPPRYSEKDVDLPKPGLTHHAPRDQQRHPVSSHLRNHISRSQIRVAAARSMRPNVNMPPRFLSVATESIRAVSAQDLGSCTNCVCKVCGTYPAICAALRCGSTLR